MIFATVGTQLNFDRMLKTVDDWAYEKDEEVFCQSGPTTLTFKKCEYEEFISPQEYAKRMMACNVLVAHAGIGSILSAFEYDKPIIIFPRHASLGEHRNEHQLATARQFEGRPGVYVAHDEDNLIDFLDRYKTLSSAKAFSPHASESLISCIKSFIHS